MPGHPPHTMTVVSEYANLPLAVHRTHGHAPVIRTVTKQLGNVGRHLGEKEADGIRLHRATATLTDMRTEQRRNVKIHRALKCLKYKTCTR